MPRFKLTIAYDGTSYAGWQVQPGHATVQQAIEETIAATVGADVAGVARGVVEADGAEVDLLLDVEDRVGEATRRLDVGSQEVIGDALRGLRADARKPAQLVE